MYCIYDDGCRTLQPDHKQGNSSYLVFVCSSRGINSAEPQSPKGGYLSTLSHAFGERGQALCLAGGSASHIPLAPWPPTSLLTCEGGRWDRVSDFISELRLHRRHWVAVCYGVLRGRIQWLPLKFWLIFSVAIKFAGVIVAYFTVEYLSTDS